MAIVEDQALILRSLRYRETSRLVVALTRRHGKLHLLAKGARDPKSPFGASLEILTRSQVVFYHKMNRELHLLKNAAVEEPHLGLLRDPWAYHVTSAALEFLLRVVPVEDPAPRLFSTLEQFLVAHERHLLPRDRDGGLKAFQLRCVALLGYAPAVRVCVRCGGPLDPPGGFGVAEGGALCRRCPAQGEVLALSPAALDRLQRLAGADTPEENGGGQESLAPEEDAQVGRIVESFLRYHVAGYQGLRALRSLLDWQRIDRPAPSGRRAQDGTRRSRTGRDSEAR